MSKYYSCNTGNLAERRAVENAMMNDKFGQTINLSHCNSLKKKSLWQLPCQEEYRKVHVFMLRGIIGYIDFKNTVNKVVIVISIKIS